MYTIITIGHHNYVMGGGGVKKKHGGGVKCFKGGGEVYGERYRGMGAYPGISFRRWGGGGGRLKLDSHAFS